MGLQFQEESPIGLWRIARKETMVGLKDVEHQGTRGEVDDITDAPSLRKGFDTH